MQGISGRSGGVVGEESQLYPADRRLPIRQSERCGRGWAETSRAVSSRLQLPLRASSVRHVVRRRLFHAMIRDELPGAHRPRPVNLALPAYGHCSPLLPHPRLARRLYMSTAPSVDAVLAGGARPPDYSPPATGIQPGQDASEAFKGGIVKRAMEKTADKLHRRQSSSSSSSSGRPQLSQSQPALPGGSPTRRIFTLSRKGKERMPVEGDGAQLHPTSAGHIVSKHGLDETPKAQSQMLSPAPRPDRHRRGSSQTSTTPADDESPFITPRSPPFGPTRSLMNIFRGDGTVSLRRVHALPITHLFRP